MLGRFGGSLSGLCVSGVLVGDSELSEVSSNHVEFDLNWLVVSSVVDTDESSDHIWHDDGVSESGLDELGLLTGFEVELALLNLLDELLVRSLDSVGSIS